MTVPNAAQTTTETRQVAAFTAAITEVCHTALPPTVT